MTLAVAFATPDSLYFIADTAVTHQGQASHPISSFGEATFDEHGQIVEEAAAKIVRLGDHMAAICVGDARASRSFLTVLRDVCIPAGGTIVDQLKQAADIKETENGPAFTILLGAWLEGKGCLFVFRSPRPMEIDTDAEIIWAGSGGQTLDDAVPWAVASAQIQTWSPAARLANVLAYVQLCGVHNEILRDGFGGAMVGARLDAEGLHWMEDTTYVFYGPSSTRFVAEVPDVTQWSPAPEPTAGTNAVTIRVRDDVVSLNSTFTPTRLKFLGHRINVPDRTAWLHTWEQHLLSLAKATDARYFVWLNRAKPVAVVFEQPRDGVQGKHLIVVPREDRVHFAMSPLAITRLGSDVPPRVDPEPDTPFRARIWFFGENE